MKMQAKWMTTIGAVLALLVAATVSPAGATKAPAPGADPADGHKITICHATRSLSNPYVEITIDVAAWNDPSDPKHHGDHHTRTKNGVTWSDYVLEDGDECTLDRPEPVFCAGVEVDTVVEFNGIKLVRRSVLTDTVSGLNIPAGTYSVVLGSSDDPHDPTQDQLNEQWRALFMSGGTLVAQSDYAEDLPNTWPASVVRPTNVGIVTLSSTVTSITAEHWDAAMTSLSADSVEPVCVGLTPVG